MSGEICHGTAGCVLGDLEADCVGGPLGVPPAVQFANKSARLLRWDVYLQIGLRCIVEGGGWWAVSHMGALRPVRVTYEVLLLSSDLDPVQPKGHWIMEQIKQAGWAVGCGLIVQIEDFLMEHFTWLFDIKLINWDFHEEHDNQSWRTG